MSNVQMLDYLLLFCAQFHIRTCVKRKWGPYADVGKAVVIYVSPFTLLQIQRSHPVNPLD